jgi:hypothetical protein
MSFLLFGQYPDKKERGHISNLFNISNYNLIVVPPVGSFLISEMSV